MPRVPRSRYHPSSAIGRTFKYKAHQKQTNIQRLLVALHATRPAHPTAIEDILEKISAQAADNEQVLGRRWIQFVHVGLSVLRKNGFLEVQVLEDNEECCRLTADGIQIMTDADASYGEIWNQLSSSEKYRRIGQYIQWKISPNPIRPLTRRELDAENREFERQQQEHQKVCPMLLHSKPHQTNATLQNDDSMDVDGVPVSGSSTTHTPLRKAATLHDPAAYPTPQSLPRDRSSSRTTSLSPPQTPLPRNHSSGILEEDQSLGDTQADNGVAITVTSNEGEVPDVRVEQVVTCHNMDWQNIRHVTAMSKALQERNDVLQREKEDLQKKMGVLEKEKEECIHQLDHANSMVEHLKAEKRDLNSQFWLYRWRSTVRLNILQNALDSAIHDRERHEQRNARLQARLDDIERRRAAIRRIQDAENAPDDQLLSMIDEGLKASKAFNA